MSLLAPKAPRLLLGKHGFLHWRKAWLNSAELSSHKHCIGLSGFGKSKFLAALCRQLFAQGIPFCLIDPANDLADDVLALLADAGCFPHRQPHPAIRYLDFSRRDRFLPFNVLHQPYPVDRIAEHIVELCLRVWPALAGGSAPTFERLMRNTVKLLVHNGLPITQVGPVLNNRALRDMLLARCPDPWVVRFFRESFEQWGREEQRMKESTVNRGELLVSTAVLRYSCGQQANALPFRALMDEQISLIVNLNGLDEQEQRWFGAFIAQGFEKGAYSRGAPGAPRTPYHLILDEFPMFTAQTEEALTGALSRTRKFGLFLTLAHQTFSQVSTRLLGALQNTTLFAFSLGARDARAIAEDLVEFDPVATKEATVGGGEEERDIAAFVGVPETYQRLKDQLKSLKPREVYLKTRQRAQVFRTMDVPPTRTTPEDLQRIKDNYARTLMRPAAAVVAEVDRPLFAARTPPRLA